MYENATLLAFIPARAGSKGLPDKNIMNCAGRPLIEWTIQAAKGVEFLDDIIVSTDSDAIADISCTAGASVPFMRPGELATDDASMLDVIRHAWLNHVTASNKPYDYIVVLQPTSPLRNTFHITRAINHFYQNRLGEDDSLASVYPVNNKYGWIMQLSEEEKYIKFCLDLHTGNIRRQMFNQYYMPNGAIFIIRGESLENGFYHKKTLPFVMTARDSIDIDTIEDFEKAEKELLNLHNKD